MVTIAGAEREVRGTGQATSCERGRRAIDPDCLLTFEYEYLGRDTEVVIDTDEFTAVCPWTGLPDTGELVISYVPSDSCIELKSLKFYLLSYRDVGHRARTRRQPHPR